MKETFGINMKTFLRSHEAEVRTALEGGRVTPALLAKHREKLGWLQHERLVHLIVLVLTCLAELFCVDLALLHPEVGTGAAVAMLCLAVLLGFYFAHYFLLENTVQRWYLLTASLLDALEGRELP